MAKQQAANKDPDQQKSEKGEKGESGSGQGSAVVLPNGDRRIDYIRNAYYNAKTGVHDESCKSRSQIKNEINEMLKNAGKEDSQIPYQIVFSATKTKEDPRKKAPAVAAGTPAE